MKECPKCHLILKDDTEVCPGRSPALPCGYDFTKSISVSAIECPNCERINPSSAVKCDCGYSFETNQFDSPTNLPSISHEHPAVIQVMKFMAWITLIFGIIGGIVLMENSLLLGVAIIIESLIICPLFLVIALIAENLFIIRNNTNRIK